MSYRKISFTWAAHPWLAWLTSCGRRLGRSETTDDLEALLHILVGRDAADGRGDLAVRSHDEGRALGESMVDVDASCILTARAGILDRQAIGLGDLPLGVGRHRDFSRAIVRIG